MNRQDDEALRILETQLANGEIGLEEYGRRYSLLMGSSASGIFYQVPEGLGSVGDAPTAGDAGEDLHFEEFKASGSRGVDPGSPSKPASHRPFNARKAAETSAYSLPEGPYEGLQIGDYLLETRVGRGGMGEIWRGRDLVGDRAVALKFLPAELIRRSDEMQRVQQSFKRVQQLQHENICPIYQLARHPAVGYFLVMKFLDALTLGDYRLHILEERQDMPLSEVGRILDCVAAALDYSHKQNIVHRDIKPQNIMVNVDSGDVQVVDFDLAAEVHQSVGAWSRLQRQQANNALAPSGTFVYMSPEQWRGQPLNGRSDQYSLAIVAYELLAGRLPFVASDPIVLRQCTLEDPIPPIDGLDPAVMEILKQALHKTPEARFPTCKQFAAAFLTSATNPRNATGPMSFEKRRSFQRPPNSFAKPSSTASRPATPAADAIPTFRSGVSSSTRRTAASGSSKSSGRFSQEAQELLCRAAARALKINPDQVDPTTLARQEHLDFTGEPIDDLRILATCRQLTRLSLAHTPVSDLNPLAKHGALQELMLQGTNVATLLPLRHLANLESLSLDDTPLSDVSPLGKSAALKHLSLRNTPVDRVSALGFLLKLKQLDLAGTKVQELGPVGRLASLRTLSLSGTPLRSLANLASLRQLRYLYLNDTDARDFPALAGLTELQQLSLQGTDLCDCGVLQRMTNLEMLSLAGTNVQDIRELAGLTKLRQLDLSNTAVSDLRPLQNLRELRWLSLQNTQVSDLALLGKLPSLACVNVIESPVSRAKVAALQAALPRLRIVQEWPQ